MKSFSKITAVVLSVILSVSFIFSINAFAQTGITFVEYGSGYKVTKIQSSAGEDVEIPSEHNGKSVVAIEKDASRDNSRIMNLTIPSSVTSIGEYAFGSCTSLETVTFIQGDSNVNIKANAFNGCSSLKSVILPKMSAIPAACFKNCIKLSDIVIPEMVTTIGEESFLQCSSLTSVDIPASVTAINNSAFYNCKGVTEYKVDSANESFKAVDGVLYSKDGKDLVQYPVGKARYSFNVPSGTESIRNGAFAFSPLESVTLPEGLKTISSYAFSDCVALKSFSFPSTLTKIGSNAFLRCSSFTVATLPSGLTSYDDAFVSSGLKKVTLSEGITTVSSNAFKECKSLSEVNLPSTVKNIQFGAFYNCTSLNSLTLPSSVETIGNNAFYGCDNLILTVDKDSYAETYAKSNSIEYKYTDEGSDPGQEEKDISVSILRFTPSRTVIYKTSITFHAEVKCDSAYTLYWVVNGREIKDTGSLSYKVSSPTDSYTINCKLVSDEKTAETDTESVTVQTGFLYKIIYFLRSIFSPSSLDIEQ